ncbi:TNT domain-containing protein [Mycobacteroides abscessus]|uniref:TNT domain-containing protein n=1 Tax=Mycobacteroides abscessus TaxID=36809 RepID=UPI001F3369A0|nr:TNT domain-containing protein [Mycobacteroides abscessus]
MTTLDEFMAAKSNAYMAVVDSWRPRTAALKANYDDYKRWATTPNGTYWSGQTATAAQEAAADDCKGTDNADDTVEDVVKLATATITYEVLPPLTSGQNLVTNALREGVTVSQDFTMTYHPAEGESEKSVARNKQIVADAERELREYVAKWEKATQELKTQTDGAREKMLSRINPKAALVDARKILRDATPGQPAAETIDYKQQYPKATDPATTQAAAATATDPHASVLGPPSPGNKPPVDPSRLGGLTGNLGVMGINEPKSPLDKPPPPPDARTMPAPKLDPNTPQGKAAIDKFRSILSTQYPPDQVEAKLSEAIKGAQQDRPMVATPEPGPPPERARESFSEAFHNSWDRGIKGVQDMVGANGLGEFKDAWGDAGTGLKNSFGELAHPTEMSPERIDNAHRLIDNPKAFLGEQSAIAAQAVPGLILGGEGAAVRAGLPAELITEGGAPRALLQDWNATGGIPWKDFETQYGTPETRVYPGNDGFPPGYTPQPAQLPPGTIIDRFGHEGGRYLAPDGASFTDRALAPEAVGGAYNRYMVTGHPLPPGWQIVEGPVQPFYGQTPSPGATQYMIVGPDGVKPSVEELIREGILTREGPPLGR